MALFRTIPPPVRDAPFIDHVDWAARRDPIGHQVHLCLAMLALALIPLSSTLATIGSTALFFYAALRAPTIHRTWRPVTGNAAFLLLLGLFGWLALSLIWSSDPGYGFRLLRGSRYLLLVPALLPLLRHGRLLLLAMCAGVFIQNIAQWFETDGTGGLSEHAGHTALWFTLAIATLILLPSDGSGSRSAHFRRCLAAIPMIGIVLSTARSALLGSGVGLTTGMALAWVRRRNDRAGAVMSGCLVIMLGIALSLSPSTPINEGMHEALDAAGAATEMDVTTHQDQVRPLWWRIGIDALKRNPVRGEGLGSSANTINNDPEVLAITEGGTRNQYVMRDDYHSLFVSVAADAGVIGVGLLLGWLTLLAIQIFRSGPYDAILLAGLVSFLVYSTFNTTLFSGRLVAFAAILMAFSTCRIPHQKTVREAVHHP